MSLRHALARLLIPPLATVGAVAFVPGTASADPSPLPLQGEFLSNLEPAQITSGSCNPTGETTITFSVSGEAAGPYPGTFTETGTATFGPMDIPIPTAPGQYRAELLAFTATFTITGLLGTVTGEKWLPEGAGSPTDAGNAAGCITGFDGAYAQILSNRLEYTAVTPFGTDSGSTAVNMNAAPNPTANSSSLQFREFFLQSDNPIVPQCSNTVDDDSDGLVDHSADPGCSSPTDTTESPNPPPPATQCANKADDDGDGFIDYPADPGCESASDDTESPNPPPPATQCANEADDDGDGFIDYPADPGCESASDDTESPNPGPATVELTPPDAVNTVGTSHIVTATVEDDAGNPVGGSTVLFSVQGSTSAGGECTTGADGRCSFTYQGPNLPGDDLVTGCADSDGDDVAEAGEPCGTATKAWVLPATTAGRATGGGQVSDATTTDDIAFGFNAKSDSKGVKGTCNVVDAATGVQIKCLDVTTLVRDGNHVTLFGDATVDGVPTTYRIDVQDNGEPGRTDVFHIETASGYTAGGVIERGNIQVH